MSSHYVPHTKIPTLVFPTSGQAARHVALMIESLIRQNNSAGRPTVLGLPTGSTPVGLYRELIRLHQRGGARLLPRRHVQPRRILPDAAGRPAQLPPLDARDVLQPRQHPAARTSTSPTAPSPPTRSRTTAADYEQKIRRAGGIDLQILGIGRTGHIGFNEPGSTPQQPHAAGHARPGDAPRRRQRFLRRGERAAPGDHDGRRHHPRRPQDRPHGVRRAQGRRSSARPSKGR